MNKIISVLLISCLLLLMSCSEADRGNPNIVLIMVDDMGYSDIGCYGGEIPTPNIDRLADDGIRFRQFYNTARCCPTRASLLTGVYQHQAGVGLMTTEGKWDFDFGVDGYRGYLNQNCVTIAEVLKSVGYNTYMTGKWHLGSDSLSKRPIQRGFDKYYGALSGAFSYFWPHGERGLTLMNDPLPSPDSNKYYTTDAFTDYAIKFIDEQQNDNPFFLYLVFNAPHWPLHAKEEDIDKFVGKYMMGWDEIRKERFARQVKMGLFPADQGISPRDERVRPWEEVSDSQKVLSDYRMAVYAAQIYSVDYNIGKLIQSLENNNQQENTLIIFLSDNGACAKPYEEFGGKAQSEIKNPKNGGAVSYGIGWANASNTPFKQYKVRAEEGGIRTPFIVRYNGINENLIGKIVDGPGHILDIMPTLVELTGAKYPEQIKGNIIEKMQGNSLMPIFKDGKRENPEFMFFEHSNNCAVIYSDWKIISRFGEFNWQLYNIKKDRNEKMDLAQENPELVNKMSEKWHEWAKNSKVVPKGSRTKHSYN